MNSFNKTVGGILSAQNQYVIPVFQRFYRWEEPQWRKLWQGIQGLREPEKKGQHFMGFLVLVARNSGAIDGDLFYIIDGQQRLTTLSLLLTALRDVAISHSQTELAAEIENLYLVHPYGKGDARYRLYPKEPDRTHYLSAVARQGTAGGRIGAALVFFREQITNLRQSEGEAALAEILKLVTQRLEFIYATLTDDNPYNIFKSLNSTGIPLGPADLIRNFIFMHVPPADQDDFDRLYWQPLEVRFQDSTGTTDSKALSAFFRDFLMRRGEYLPPTDTFVAFEAAYEATDFAPRELASTLNQHAEYYSILLGKQPDRSPVVSQALRRLRDLDSSTTFPLLLRLFELRDAGVLQDNDFAGAVRVLCGFIFRRFVCGEQSRGYGHLFAQAAKALSGQPDQDLRVFLEDRTYPDDGWFKSEFVSFPLYRRGYCAAVLQALEQAMNPKETHSFEKVEIEHIMPQTLNDAWRATLGEAADEVYQTWLHTPGNLTLTGWNGTLSNSPFEVKRAKYRESNYSLTRAVAEHSGWTAAEIQQRGTMLAHLAAELWPGPATPVVGRAATPSQLQLEYWIALESFLHSQGDTVDETFPKKRSWVTVRTDEPGRQWYSGINLKTGTVRAGLWLTGAGATSRYRFLEGQRSEIETTLGTPVEWLSGTRELFVRSLELDLEDRTAWRLVHEWTRETLARLTAVLEPYLDQHDEQTEPERHEARRQYWAGLAEVLRQAGSNITPPTVTHQYYRTYPIQVKGVSLWTEISRRKRHVSVGLSFRGQKGKALYEKLLTERAAVEADLKITPTWYQLSGGSYLEIRLENTDPQDKSAWPDQHQWLREQLEAVYSHLEPRLQRLAP